MNSCKKEQTGTDFLQKEWKVKTVTNESKRLMVPANPLLKEDAYILKFVNDSCFALTTSVNYGGGEYQIVSEGNIIINHGDRTMVGSANEHMNFEKQLLLGFNGEMTYSYTKNKLIFRGEQNREVVFERRK